MTTMTTVTRSVSESAATEVARLQRSVSVPGLVWATGLYLSSITPSLLPRSWYLQALTSGICTAYGYGFGVFIGWLWQKVSRLIQLQVTVSARSKKWLTRGGGAALAAITVAWWLLSWEWQRQTAELVGLPAAGPISHCLSLLATMVVFAGLILMVRALRGLTRSATRAGRRFVRPAVARSLAVLLVGLSVWFVSNSVVYRGFMEFTAARAAEINSTAPAGRGQPVSPLRSGGPGSTESWTSLGRNGQAFVADGSTREAITAATGVPAKEPIRVYAGLSGGRSIEDVADAAVVELRRTGGFERAVLAVMTTTGRGWVDEWSASSVEYLAHGDSAIVAIQYSYLPSFVALMADQATPARAGRVLLGKVHAEWSRLPIGHRPKLVVGGESLGAYGGQAAFAGAEDMLATIDGAVWVGTPNFTPLWRDLTDHRQGGSPEVAPVIDGGEHIRFATAPVDLTQDIYARRYGDWRAPRVVYLQHASDPITWWSPDLLTDEPDWLRERVGHDVNDIHWASFASFWQLTTDLFVANGTPPGHGHRYTEELVPAWAGVLGLDPATDYSRIRAAIAKDYRPV